MRAVPEFQVESSVEFLRVLLYIQAADVCPSLPIRDNGFGNVRLKLQRQRSFRRQVTPVPTNRFQLNWPASAPLRADAEVCLAARKRITMDNSDTVKYPMLEAILAIQDLPLQPMYTIRDVAKIFKVCVRAIQNWISAGRLTARSLPGRWKFFPQDLEEFLQSSPKERR